VNRLDPESWNELWRVAGVPAKVSSWYEQLMSLYSQPHRHYHNREHIVECLKEFDAARQLAYQPRAVELAIWFHDVIYDPHASDNEEQSAELAKRCIADLRGAEDLGESVAQLILATKQHDHSLHTDAPLLVDIDLSILGQPADRFWEYEEQIRKEYHWVPKFLFAPKRAKVLKRFLAREKIYNTQHFFRKYEAQARKNLTDSIQKLR
jgi:predicted metal-dependent HD superfamily phosphohydrolase